MARPWISINLALSADGKISSVGLIPSGWTSREDHQRLLSLRQSADALIVGRGTLEADQMTLTKPGDGTQPLRCVVSRSGRIDPNLPLFKREGGGIHVLVTDGGNPVFPTGVSVHHGSLRWFLDWLGDQAGVGHLHCEGGGELVRSLAELDAIDEMHLTIAGQTLFGGAAAATATGVPGDFLSPSLCFNLSHFEARPDIGECFLSYRRAQ